MIYLKCTWLALPMYLLVIVELADDGPYTLLPLPRQEAEVGPVVDEVPDHRLSQLTCCSINLSYF